MVEPGFPSHLGLWERLSKGWDLTSSSPHMHSTLQFPESHHCTFYHQCVRGRQATHVGLSSVFRQSLSPAPLCDWGCFFPPSSLLEKSISEDSVSERL